MTKEQIIRALIQLSIDMQEVGIAITNHYGEDEHADHGKEMIRAGIMAGEWAACMDEEQNPFLELP